MSRNQLGGVFKEHSHNYLVLSCIIAILLGVVTSQYFETVKETPAPAVAQKALNAMQTSIQPKSGDMVFPSSHINQRGMIAWQWGTIIDPHTGAMSACVLDNGAELQVTGAKAEHALLVVRGDQKQMGKDTCAKGQEILLLVEVVTEFQKKRAHMLQMETAAMDENAKNLELIKAIKSEAANH